MLQYNCSDFVGKSKNGEKSVNNIKNKIAVLDTETTWQDKVMSIGIVIANPETFEVTAERYYIITPECDEGGMFSHALDKSQGEMLAREDAMSEIIRLLSENGISSVFAYNACFDFRHLPELSEYGWYDIMRVAACKKHNKYIPDGVPLCKSGRMKSGYGVEPILAMLSGGKRYSETHNALLDALDELKIMKLLGCPIEIYPQIN